MVSRDSCHERVARGVCVSSSKSQWHAGRTTLGTANVGSVRDVCGAHNPVRLAARLERGNLPSVRLPIAALCRCATDGDGS
jgi:hypothetical protein